MKRRSTLPVLLLVCAIGGLLAQSPAFGDNIERSCQARYIVYLKYGPPTQRAPGPGIPILMKGSEFSARRGCGSNVPNRCRERARDAIMQCMKDHSQMGWNAVHTMPAACTSNGVQNYPITDIFEAVQETVCNHLKWDKEKSRWEHEPDLDNADLWADISGNAGCNKRYHINYFRVTCTPPPR